jgi:hypothetical protein
MATNQYIPPHLRVTGGRPQPLPEDSGYGGQGGGYGGQGGGHGGQGGGYGGGGGYGNPGRGGYGNGYGAPQGGGYGGRGGGGFQQRPPQGGHNSGWNGGGSRKIQSPPPPKRLTPLRALQNSYRHPLPLYIHFLSGLC